jgi:nicotinate-nucleotide adenylyltransferase
MNIGVYGGSFNPIHNGHIHLATAVRDTLSLDRVILVPSKVSPHKSNVEYVPNTHRLAMCELAIQGVDNLEVSDYELLQDGISYSIYTVRYFKATYPNDRLYLLIGSDMFLTFDTWKEYREIMRLVTLAVVSREVGDMLALESKRLELSPYGEIVVAKVPPLEVSSTEIRKNIRFNTEYSCNLDEKVVQYIKSNGLYLS